MGLFSVANERVAIEKLGYSVYRQKIQDYYINLSPSYRKVADFVMSHYYEVAFMTAAQLAGAVDVDTTTVVRFSQRLGYQGYPELLQDVRIQVKEELYAVYEPVSLGDSDPAAVFKAQIDQESANLRQILVHNPPGRLHTLVKGIQTAKRILFVAEGDLAVVVQIVAAQLRRRGMQAEAVAGDPAQQALLLSGLTEMDTVVGVCGRDEGVGIARCLALARQQGCHTFGVVGKLDGAVVRWTDGILYVPAAEGAGSHMALVALTGALMALVQAAMPLVEQDGSPNQEAIRTAYRFLAGGTAFDG